MSRANYQTLAASGGPPDLFRRDEFSRLQQAHLTQNRYELRRFVFRRSVYYLYLFTFTSLSIINPWLITNLTFWFLAAHVLYFELDLSHYKNTYPVRFLHPISFTGSYMVMILFTLLITIFSPDFISDSAKKGGYSLGLAWIGTIWLHYVPPILHAFDLWAHRQYLRERYSLVPGSRWSYLTISWFAIGPVALTGVWFLAGFTMETIYKTHDNHWTATISSSLLACGVATGVLWRVTRMPRGHAEAKSGSTF